MKFHLPVTTALLIATAPILSADQTNQTNQAVRPYNPAAANPAALEAKKETARQRRTFIENWRAQHRTNRFSTNFVQANISQDSRRSKLDKAHPTNSIPTDATTNPVVAPK